VKGTIFEALASREDTLEDVLRIWQLFISHVLVVGIEQVEHVGDEATLVVHYNMGLALARLVNGKVHGGTISNTHVAHGAVGNIGEDSSERMHYCINWIGGCTKYNRGL
jgi:hypothetical protein